MIVLNTLSFDELQEKGLSELKALGFSSNSGSICRLFLSLINEKIGEAYTALTINHLRAFLSTSDGDALDAIGVLLNCKRRTGELDSDYQYRISKQCLVLASSNETAIRLAALSVKGVSSAKLKPYASGAGTFTILIVLDGTRNADDTLKDVKETVEQTMAYGVKCNITTPTLVPLKMSFKLYFKDEVSTTDSQSLIFKVKEALTDYIANLDIGEPLMIDQITQTIMDVSDDILSHQNVYFELDNQRALYVNQSIRWFEKFTLSPDADNIVIS